MNLGEARQRAYLNGFKSAADQAAHPWTPADKSLPINQIVNGNSIELLNGLKPGWVDLVFADHLRNWIIWHYTFGQQTKKMFAKSHTHILYFTKEKPTAGLNNITFNADAVRVASARQTVYADLRANSKGKLPDDTWFLRPQEAGYFESSFKTLPPPPGETTELSFFDPVSSTWNISRICGTFKEREGWHGCQMPIGVLDRIIKASSHEGDVVLDPFNGSGTTCVSAALLGRKFVGFDQSAEYVAYARTRLEHALNAKAGVGDVFDKKRRSKVQTKTDAFGRPRVKRTYGKKSPPRVNT